MTPTLVALLKIIAAVFGIYVICKLETYLENKTSETSGVRTDILFITSIIGVIILSVFIFSQSWIILKVLFS